MSDADCILEVYRAADECQRLSLYLSHRDLRNEFLAILLSQGFTANAQAHGKTNGFNFTSRNRSCRGFLTGLLRRAGCFLSIGFCK